MWSLLPQIAHLTFFPAHLLSFCIPKTKKRNRQQAHDLLAVDSKLATNKGNSCPTPLLFFPGSTHYLYSVPQLAQIAVHNWLHSISALTQRQSFLTKSSEMEQEISFLRSKMKRCHPSLLASRLSGCMLSIAKIGRRNAI